MLDRDLREIIDLARQVGVTEIDLAHGDLRLRVRRQALPAAASPPVISAAPPDRAPASVEAATALQAIVRAPMVGYFFSGARPGEPPCLTAGERISAGARIGCVETMGMVAEVTAPVAGTVQEYLVHDGSAVEFGQPLVRVLPSDVPGAADR